MHSSHIAARLNGYLVGVGGIEQFLKEADYLGLNEGQKDYVKKYIEKHEGGGLYCWLARCKKIKFKKYTE